MLFYLKFSENFFADFFWQIHKYFQLINMYVPITGVLNHFLNLLANILMFISNKKKEMPGNSAWILFIYLLVYVAFNSQGHIATGSLQVEKTSAYCTVNHQASTSNYQLSNMKRLARDSNRRPQRLERTLTATPLSPLKILYGN